MLAKCKDLNVIAKITSALGHREMSEAFTLDAIQMLQNLTSLADDDDDLGIDVTQVRAVHKAMRRHKVADDHCGNLLENLKTRVKEEGPEAIEGRVNECMGLIQAASHIEKLKTDEGRVYYKNNKTMTTSWDPPPEISALQDAFKVLDELQEKFKDDADPINDATVANVMKTIATVDKNLELLRMCLSTLSKIVKTKDESEDLGSLSTNGGEFTDYSAETEWGAGAGEDWNGWLCSLSPPLLNFGLILNRYLKKTKPTPTSPRQNS